LHVRNEAEIFIVLFESVSLSGVRLRLRTRNRVSGRPPQLACLKSNPRKITMKTAIVKTLTVATAALMLAAASGCTSQDTLAKIDAATAAAKSAQADAAAAKSAADAAAAAASSAGSAASSAQSTANQALQAAQAAQSCCDATNEKIDRAFKRSMGK